VLSKQAARWRSIARLDSKSDSHGSVIIPRQSWGLWELSRSKRQKGSLTRLCICWPSEGGQSTPQILLVQAAVRLLLVSDVLLYHRFVPTYGRDGESSCPEMLPYKIALLLRGQVDRTFALDKTDDLQDRAVLVVSKSSYERGPDDLVRSGFCCDSLRNSSPSCRLNSP
jgi:hypothetical protein